VLPTPFALGKYAVTFDEFDHFVRESGHGHSPGSNGWGRGSRPVIDVSWDDAVAYCRWLSEETGHDYRLPTEAEWEYACRAGTTTPFHFGETISTDQANYGGDFTYGNGLEGEFREKTMKVGQFPANVFGLHEMHGNVWEWCADCYEKDAYDEHMDVYPDMVGDLESSGDRVIRGGSWINRPGNLRSATRTCVSAGNRRYFLGFRIARKL
jgi:formylglycine-generating enzyme required for sulfatase activity